MSDEPKPKNSETPPKVRLITCGACKFQTAAVEGTVAFCAACGGRYRTEALAIAQVVEAGPVAAPQSKAELMAVLRENMPVIKEAIISMTGIDPEGLARDLEQMRERMERIEAATDAVLANTATAGRILLAIKRKVGA